MILSGQIFKRCVVRLCNELIKKEEELNELDRRSGDGDCGSTLRLGAEGRHGLIVMTYC